MLTLYLSLRLTDHQSDLVWKWYLTYNFLFASNLRACRQIHSHHKSQRISNYRAVIGVGVRVKFRDRDEKQFGYSVFCLTPTTVIVTPIVQTLLWYIFLDYSFRVNVVSEFGDCKHNVKDFPFFTVNNEILGPTTCEMCSLQPREGRPLLSSASKWRTGSFLSCQPKCKVFRHIGRSQHMSWGKCLFRSSTPSGGSPHCSLSALCPARSWVRGKTISAYLFMWPL